MKDVFIGSLSLFAAFVGIMFISEKILITEKKQDYYYANIFAFPDEKHSKNYFVKAKIYPDSSCDYDADDRYYCDNTTQIDRIYFNNGSLGFEDCTGFNKKGKNFECVSEKGETWSFKYYGEKLKD